ncbi:MAG: hypothetical protein ABIP42_18020 [Planctomycetota bacterium]
MKPAYTAQTYRLSHRQAPAELTRREWRGLMLPAPGFMTTLCWALGTFDVACAGFILSRLIGWH